MRVSGIEQFLGGADNVIALEILQGEQRVLKGTLKDGDGNALDITNFVLDVGQEFFLADVTTTSRSTTITSLTTRTPSNTPGDIAIAKGATPADGEFTLTIPDDLYTDSISTDIATDVPVCVAYAKYGDGPLSDADTVTRVNRFVIIIRRAVFS